MMQPFSDNNIVIGASVAAMGLLCIWVVSKLTSLNDKVNSIYQALFGLPGGPKGMLTKVDNNEARIDTLEARVDLISNRT